MTGAAPTLRLVRGDAGPEELAALLAVLTARTEGAPAGRDPARPRAGRWADRAAMLRLPPHPAPGGWRASARPH